MNKLGLKIPINHVSFGSVSIALLREIFNRDLMPAIFPIGNVDLSAQIPDENFQRKLQTCINEAFAYHQRKYSCLSLWHIVDSLSTYSSADSRLITFHELDSLTPTEINVLKQHDKVYVTSNYTKHVFGIFGINSEYIPLGFDHHNFKQDPENKFRNKDVITFFMGGKFEPLRKQHTKILNLWAKKYGNNRDYALICSLRNPFLKPEDENMMIAQALEGKRYWNINFLPWQKTNAEYNQTLQAANIVFALSGGEGRDLPCYHATAMGAWPLALRAHAYMDYLNDENAILINPNGKMVAHDGMFFIQGGKTNSGNLFTWREEDFYNGCEKVIKKAKDGLNTKGMELQKQTYKEAVDILLKGIDV